MLTLNHGYQKSARMVGVAYKTLMSGLEGAAKMNNCLVMLDSSVATAKNKETNTSSHRSRTSSHRSRLRLAAMIVSRALNCGWPLPHGSAGTPDEHSAEELMDQQQQQGPVQNLNRLILISLFVFLWVVVYSACGERQKWTLYLTMLASQPWASAPMSLHSYSPEAVPTGNYSMA